jgi:hypothetical protein
VAGTSTLLNASNDTDGQLTYYLEDSTGACNAWGDDPTYYATCVDLNAM